MKTTKKLFIATAIISTSFLTSYANEDATQSGSLHPKKEEMREYNSQIKASLDKQKAGVQQNIQEFHDEYGMIEKYLSGTTQETRDAIKNLFIEHKTQMEALRKSFEEKISSSTSLDEKEAHRKEMLDASIALRNTFSQKVLEIAGENTELKAFFEARSQVRDKNETLRQDGLSERQNIRSERSEKIVQYKEAYAKKVGSQLEKIKTKNPEKLEKIQTTLEKKITSVENNSKLTETQKETTLSQLEALKSLIEEILGEEIEESI
jgi:hypothetical protein